MGTFSNLNARANGGIVLLDSEAFIYDSSFFNCTAESSGSAIFADHSDLVVHKTVL